MLPSTERLALATGTGPGTPIDVIRHKSLTRTIAFQPSVPLLTLFDDVDYSIPAKEDPVADFIPSGTDL